MFALRRAIAATTARVSVQPGAASALLLARRGYAGGLPIDRVIMNDHERINALWNEFKTTYQAEARQATSPTKHSYTGDSSAGTTPKERARQGHAGMPRNPGADSAEASTLSYDGPQVATGGANTRQSTATDAAGVELPVSMTEEAKAKLTRVKNSLLREIAVHSVAEEVLVYPELRRFRGDEAANHLLEDQQMVKEECYDIDAMPVDNPNLMPRLRKVMANLQMHIAEEENVELPELRARLDDEWLVSLGTRFEMLKHTVPTRAHPSAPQQPLAEAVVGMMTAPLDRMMDLGRQFATEEDVSQQSAKKARR